jgi:hypothetical protein
LTYTILTVRFQRFVDNGAKNVSRNSGKQARTGGDVLA